MIDEDPIREWLAAYRHAWSGGDAAEVAGLFDSGGRAREFVEYYMLAE